MKKILIVALCLFVGSVSAQDLFPELAGMGGRTRSGVIREESKPVTTPQNGAVSEEDDLPVIASESVEVEGQISEEVTEETESVASPAANETDLFAASQPKEVPTETPAEEEEEEEDETQRITVYLSDAQSTITPNRDFSYCFGVLKFLNTLKKPVQSLSFVLKYGALTQNYNAKNLMPNQEQTGSIGLVGRACEQIMNMPEITISKCVVEGMSEAACKKKFEFLPLRGE